MFFSSVKEYGHQNYQNPLLLRRDPIFVRQIVILIALAILITIFSFLYSRYCSYPQFACSNTLSSNSSRQKLRRYAQLLGGLMVLEKTTRDNNTKSPIDEGEGGEGRVITTGYSPIEREEKSSSYIKGSSHLGQGLGQGPESLDPSLSWISSDTESNLVKDAVVKDAIEAIKEGEEEMHPSTRKLSLEARRTAFLAFLAQTEYHQTSPHEQQGEGEEEDNDDDDDDDDDDDTVIVPRHYSFSRGMEVFGKNTSRHHSIT